MLMMFHKLTLVLLLNFYIFSKYCVNGANILAINALLSPSHHIFIDRYLLELAKNGHNVTLLGHDEDKHHHPNYTHIVMDGVYKKMRINFDVLNMKDHSELETIKSMWDYNEITCLLDYETEGLRKIVSYPEGFKFDLIIWNNNNGQCLFPLFDKFGRPPIIAVNPFLNQPNIFNNVWQSYIPFLTYTLTDHMNLWQRFKSSFFNIILDLIRVYYYLPRQEKLYESYFGKQKFTIEEIERNVSIVLTATNPVFNYAEALPPNVIPVGGFHIESKQLPQEIKVILDRSKNGAILFSLGTNIKSEDLGEEKISVLLKTFSKLKQNVIWKFENDLSGIPNNVYIKKWLPQNDILAHKNTILFISHGGLLSSHEAVYNGVPVIAVPFFLDQWQNAGNFVAKKVGEKICFDEIVGDNLYNLIQKVVNNRSYTDNMKRLSALFKHDMTTPMDRALYWTDYILKFKSAKHFNLATRDMNFIELTNFDIIFIFLLMFSGTVFAFFVSFLYCIRIFVVKSGKVKDKIM